MRTTDIINQYCPVARSIAVVGNAWSLLLLRELFLGSRRYEDLAMHTGMSSRLLAQRLRTLEDEGVVERQRYQERPPRDEYRLTAKGRDLWPLIVALRTWGERWHEWPEGRPVRLRHRGCGRLAEPRHVCSHCSEPVHAQDMEFEMSAYAVDEREARRPRRIRVRDG